MKKFLLFTLFLGSMIAAMAQFPIVKIRDIQQVDQDTLAACIDRPPLLGDTVIIFATVYTDGRVEDPQNPGQFIRNATPGNHHNVWVADTVGPWSGIDIFHLNGETTPTSPVDMLDLIAGDSVKITGVVEEFRTESELFPISVELVGTSNRPITPTPVNIADFNDDMFINNLETGEQWEGVYVEFYDAEVDNVTVTGGNRVFIDVKDAQGNKITLSDRFMFQQQPQNGGAFVPPAVGTVFDTIRGVIEHSRPSGCAGTEGDGYQIYVFQESDYVIRPGNVPPSLTNLRRSPATPTSSSDVTISVTADDPDGGLNNVDLFYAVGQFNTTFTQVAMTDNGTAWEATIPAAMLNDGDFVKIYVCATDVDNLTQCFPNVPDNADPQFFVVRDNGASIVDVQFTPYSNGESSYRGYTTTVEGIVTSTANSGDLGFIYIMQEGEDEWSGLSLTDNAGLNTLNRGDKVEVTGEIQESFGFTVMEVTNLSVMSTGNSIEPVAVNPNDFTTYSSETTEPFEGMLVTLTNPNAGDPIYIVNKNADGPNSNFAEYRVGSDRFDPSEGCRVLAGRRTGSAPSSLVFSFVNDSSWIVDSGPIDTTQLAYDICVVNVGDTLCGMTGIMYYSFSEMKLLPRNDDDVPSFVDANNERQPAYSGENCRIEGGFASIDCANLTTNVDVPFALSDVRVFPNPAASNLTVTYDWSAPVQAQVELRDLMGRVVAVKTINGQNGEVNLNVETLAEGAYMMMIRTETQIIAQDKVLIVK